ncbi:glycosyltransferase family 4 protein [Clostridium sp. LBM24168]
MIYIIRVLHIISGNDNGGGGRHVLNVCSNNMYNMKCCIMCIGSGLLYNKAIHNNIDAFNFTFNEIVRGKLKSIVNSRKIDIINFHGAKSNFLYLILNRSIKKPCVATIHSDYRYDFLNSILKKYLYTPLSIMGLRKFKNYICVSNYLKILLEENNFVGSKYVVNNGMNFNSVKIAVYRDDLRAQFNLDKDDFVYVMIARMHPVKNHKKLIEAFYMLQGHFQNVKLFLVGDGELEDSLKHLVEDLKIQDKVIFTGFKNNPLDFINASDISILTSFNEGGAPPLAILESALLKKSVICSNVGDMNLVISNKSGYLVNPKDKQDIFNKMKEAYLNRNNLCNMGQNLYKDMSDKFSMERFWENYYNAYLHILSGVK